MRETVVSMCLCRQDTVTVPPPNVRTQLAQASRFSRVKDFEISQKQMERKRLFAEQPLCAIQ